MSFFFNLLYFQNSIKELIHLMLKKFFQLKKQHENVILNFNNSKIKNKSE